jgi:hypothetical protein
MQTTAQNTDLSLQQLYQIVAQFSIEQQLTIAEHIKKQALAAKWNQFAETMPTDEPDISDEEIIEEIKVVRAERRGK